MKIPEGNDARLEDNTLPDDGGASYDHESGCWPQPEYLAEPAIDSGDMLPPRHQWFVEVVPSQVFDSANRVSRAIDILLNAAARLRA